MPRNKDLKRNVRRRMTKTGESYTAARSQIVKKTAPLSGAADPTENTDYAALAGRSEATLVARTGRTWTEWVRELDAHDAQRLRHGEIAALVTGAYGIDNWWAQTVAVGYERIKGLRERGQRFDGAFEAGKSRTFNVPVSVLFDAWDDEAVRNRWLTDASPVVRTSSPSRGMRLQWPDGTSVVVWFQDKGVKSSVTIQHQKLADAAAVERVKREWTARLGSLAELLTTPQA